jgi:hypothetical protein
LRFDVLATPLSAMVNLHAPDFTQHPPRSPRVRLGGFVHLPRLLDKARAEVAGKNAEFNYNCPLDRHFFDFTGIDPAAMLAEVKAGKTDGEMLAWITSRTSRGPSEIAAWSVWLSSHGPGGKDGHGWFAESLAKIAPERRDIQTFFDLLDLDDYASYGEKV